MIVSFIIERMKNKNKLNCNYTNTCVIAYMLSVYCTQHIDGSRIDHPFEHILHLHWRLIYGYFYTLVRVIGPEGHLDVKRAYQARPNSHVKSVFFFSQSAAALYERNVDRVLNSSKIKGVLWRSYVLG